MITTDKVNDKQKEYLMVLLNKHKQELKVPIDTLTRGEAGWIISTLTAFKSPLAAISHLFEVKLKMYSDEEVINALKKTDIKISKRMLKVCWDYFEMRRREELLGEEYSALFKVLKTEENTTRIFG